VKEVCDVFRSIAANKVTPIHMVAIQALSSMVCPVYGDFYSFPWKRGPHDSILEYNEASSTFEALRQLIYNELKNSDFVGRCLMVFNKEDESKHVEVRCSVLRIMVQMLISFNEKPNDALSMFLNDKNFKT